MSEEMGTTTTVLTESESRLAGTEQVKPTPGPWYASRKHAYVMTGNYAVVAEIRGRPEQGANAVLIAAAPDLLAACKEFVRKVDAGEARSTRSYAQMKSAIAKAEGRTP